MNRSLAMMVGRVVLLPELTPLLLPICEKPLLKLICGGTLWLNAPAICGRSPTYWAFIEP